MGDQSAYAELVSKYTKGLRYHIARMVNSQRHVEDLVQESFVKAFSALHSYSTGYAFSTWLYKIATNHAIDFMRKRRLDTVSLDTPLQSEEKTTAYEIPDQEYRPDKHIIHDQRREILQVAIDRLPPKYRRVIVMRHQEELSYQEIAEELDLPLGTVKAHIFRARKLLYKDLRGKREKI